MRRGDIATSQHMGR